LEIEAPGCQAASSALTFASNIYNIFAFGNRIIKLKSTISIISSVNPGNIIKIEFNGTYFALFVVSKDIDFMNYCIEYTCISMERTFPTV
jgi:hypothetical protein